MPELFSTVEQLIVAAQSALSPRRQLHVLGVTHTVCVLAAVHGLDVMQAALAGLLHDLSKEMTPEALKGELDAAGIELPADDAPFPRTWHGFHAAALAPARWGICDEAVLEAVRLHTTADDAFGPLGRALFVADFCEPNRRIAEAPQVYAEARRDLDAGFRLALHLKTRHMLARAGFVLNPRATRAISAWLGADYRGDHYFASPDENHAPAAGQM